MWDEAGINGRLCRRRRFRIQEVTCVFHTAFGSTIYIECYLAAKRVYIILAETCKACYLASRLKRPILVLYFKDVMERQNLGQSLRQILARREPLNERARPGFSEHTNRRSLTIYP
jgi:hypothetical protein